MSKQTNEHFQDINGLEILYEKNEFFPLLEFQVFFSVLCSEFVISDWVSCFVERFLSPVACPWWQLQTTKIKLYFKVVCRYT